MGIPIEVKETAPVSTYLDACTLLAWKASNIVEAVRREKGREAMTRGWGEVEKEKEKERERESECALRVLLTQMISRLDIQRGIL